MKTLFVTVTYPSYKKYGGLLLAPHDIGGWISIRGIPIPIPKKDWVGDKIKETARKGKAWFLKQGRKKKNYIDLLDSVECMSEEHLTKYVTMSEEILKD